MASLLEELENNALESDSLGGPVQPTPGTASLFEGLGTAEIPSSPTTPSTTGPSPISSLISSIPSPRLHSPFPIPAPPPNYIPDDLPSLYYPKSGQKPKPSFL